MTDTRPTWTILGMMEWATGYFESRGVDQPRLSIEWLLSHVLRLPRLNLYLQHDRPLSAAELDVLRPLVKRRSEHEPLQYISGTAPFMELEFVVDARVLIPRPETEEMVERILAAGAATAGTVIDLGTGSGCIPITLKRRRPDWTCIGIDLSEDALAIARLNAARLNADVTFHRADMTLDPSDRHASPRDAAAIDDLLPGTVDIIVSNPPYIAPAEAASMDRQVKAFEPSMALFTPDPVGMALAIVRFACRRLAIGGRLHMELNPLFADAILEASLALLPDAALVRDMSGSVRFLEAVRRS